MSLSENEKSMPVGGNDNANIIDSDDDGDGKGRKSNDSNKPFHMELFHQLHRERLENQRRAERERILNSNREDDQKNRQQQRWDYSTSTSTTLSSYQSNAANSSTSLRILRTTAQRRSSQSPASRSSSSSSNNSSSETKNTYDTSLARRELLRLGKRYASFSSSALHSGRRPSSGTIGALGNVTENIQSQHTSFYPSPANNAGSVNQISEIGGGSSVALESGVFHDSLHSHHYLDVDSRSFSTPLETWSHYDYDHGDIIPLVTPDGKTSSSTNNNDIEELGMYGSQYLLLARANSSPAPAPKAGNPDDIIIMDADDEVSSSTSFSSTPTPNLQAASACNSHGENEYGVVVVCEDNNNQHCHQREEEDDDVVEEGETIDHFTSFCKAQVLISEMEQKESIEQEESVIQDTRKDNLVQHKRSCHWRTTTVQFALVTFAGVAVFFTCRCVAIWYKETFPEIPPMMLFTAQLRTWIESMGILRDSMQNALHSKMTIGMMKISLLHARYSSQLMLWAKFVRSTLATVYSEWVEEVDVLSWIINKVYRLEKIYYDAHQYYFTTADFESILSELQASSAAAFNITLSVAVSCWQQRKSVQLGDLFCKSKDHIVISKSALTSPLIICPNNDGCHPRTLENETLALLDMDDNSGVKPIEDISHPQFWRKSTGGTPFIRQPLPSLRNDFRLIHSIPSLGAQPEESALSKPYWHITTGLTLSELQHPKERSRKYQVSVLGLSHPRLSLNNLRLDSIGLSSDIRKNIAAMIVQNSRQPHQHHDHVGEQQPAQAMITEERNYYTSSYPKQHEQALEKDGFEDVDVMGIASDFLGQFLQRVPRNNKKRRKRSKTSRRS